MTDTQEPRKNASDTRGKPFEPGNPGRPRGARNKVTRAVEALLNGEAEALTRKAVELAKDGDLQALKLCIDRLCPVPKDRPVVVDGLPELKTAEDFNAAMARIVEAAASGELTPSEAADLAKLIETGRRTLETVEIERRLAALEARQ